MRTKISSQSYQASFFDVRFNLIEKQKIFYFNVMLSETLRRKEKFNHMEKSVATKLEINLTQLISWRLLFFSEFVRLKFVAFDTQSNVQQAIQSNDTCDSTTESENVFRAFIQWARKENCQKQREENAPTTLFSNYFVAQKYK